MANFTDAETSNYYDSYSDVYALIWGQQMHTGYFDTTEKTLVQACEDMNVHLAQTAHITPGTTILNIGCGRGGTDCFLVEKYNVNAIGLDISTRQLEEAKVQAHEKGLDTKIKYIQGSMTDLPVADASVDYVWIQESLFHCHKKEAAIKEFYRVLKPGGIVILEDTVLLENSARPEVMAVFGERVHINEILTPDDYQTMFTHHQFKISHYEDLTDHLERTYRATAEYINEHQEEIKQKIGEQHWQTIYRNPNRERTLALVSEKKLGCIALYCQKLGNADTR